MESQSNEPPLVVIVGPTASGKSALAIALAKQFNGEIIAADSRTLYAKMDIGTAKPSRAQLAEVPHHLIDISTPDDPLTAADVAQLIKKKISEISARGKVPFLVGGTGLYIDAVLYDFSFAPKPDSAEREKWSSLTIEELQAEIHSQGIAMPTNSSNPRHLIRQLETGGHRQKQSSLRDNTLILGLNIEHEVLKDRIVKRVGDMFVHGLPEEVTMLVREYGWDNPVMQTIGYREFRVYDPDQQLSELKDSIIRNTLQYAKRQRTWFKRNKSIHWISKQEESVDLITSFLNK